VKSCTQRICNKLCLRQAEKWTSVSPWGEGEGAGEEEKAAEEDDEGIDLSWPEGTLNQARRRI
jgi:hypothetical protein